MIGASAGITIGSAAAAFITLLKVVPRMAQITETRNQVKLYEYTIMLGATSASFIYFSDFNLNISKFLSIPIGITMGIFFGLFASALAEVLNVIPVFAKKFKAKHELQYIIAALILGKVTGALYYWLIFINK
ncbi:stage V sporulation protein AB [Schnuerera sp.]|uniref:stage V sporulation protein AB n=1 Tax=Schnuerera sp. TaxID=2794844 RepID=UPI002C127E02|nr:stage V sporulation protein AB [Schnuerera sp.]HSH36439.1 stage V sporulation protein AB [Schnuerera sp.]